VTVLFDTNVLIGAAVPARAHHGAAVRLIAAAERGGIDGLFAPSSVATCWYVAREREGTDPRPLFDLLADVMRVAPMGRSPLRTALQDTQTGDFEDAYLAAAGAAAGAAAVTTHNEADFRETPLTPYHPLDLAEMLTG